jgi:hypothetical protein
MFYDLTPLIYPISFTVETGVCVEFASQVSIWRVQGAILRSPLFHS